ncbi:hypothetical protein ACWCYY_18260 [Kitasatospora sp. NPDC001664]
MAAQPSIDPFNPPEDASSEDVDALDALRAEYEEKYHAGLASALGVEAETLTTVLARELPTDVATAKALGVKVKPLRDATAKVHEDLADLIRDLTAADELEAIIERLPGEGADIAELEKEAGAFLAAIENDEVRELLKASVEAAVESARAGKPLEGVVVEVKPESTDYAVALGDKAEETTKKATELTKTLGESMGSLAKSAVALAQHVYDVRKQLTNGKGLEDLKGDSPAAQAWKAKFLDDAGLAPAEGDSPAEAAEKLKNRERVDQAIAEAMSPIRVLDIRDLDNKPEELAARFPGMTSSADVFKAYKLKDKTQAEIRAENYRLKKEAERAALEAAKAKSDAGDGEGGGEGDEGGEETGTELEKAEKKFAAVKRGIKALTKDEALDALDELTDARKKEIKADAEAMIKQLRKVVAAVI